MLTIWKEIGDRRNLLCELVVKDLKLRYSRSMFGFFWALILPLLTVITFFMVFSLFLKVKIEETPFILYLMTSIFTWRFFQESLSGATTSLLDNKNLLREARFPAYFVPLSMTMANMINLLPCLVIILVTACLVLRGVSILIIFLPMILITHFLMTMGFSILLSISYLKWRDLKYLLEGILLLLSFLTPSFYSMSLVKAVFPSWLFAVYLYNPLTGILNFYRCVLLKGFYSHVADMVSPFSLVICPVLFSFCIAWLGFFAYKRHKNEINDQLSY